MFAASLTFDERYRAIDARDARFDGQFVTAVRSTGIYCRPSCPARTPKPENVTFYPTSAAAHEAGYRACKRCLPEAAPGSPAWNLRGDVAGRAMRLIADGVVEREGVPGLAARLGYSSRHLTRLLTEELGAGPLALARAQRAHGADAPRLDRSAGIGRRVLGGIRERPPVQRHHREVFGMAPLHCAPVGAAMPRSRTGRDRPRSAAPRPLDVAGLFAWMAARAVAGAEVGAATSFARTVRLPGGPAWFELRTDDAGRVRLRAKLTQLGDLPVLVARARRLFDLDADPLAVDAALSAHRSSPRSSPGSPASASPVRSIRTRCSSGRWWGSRSPSAPRRRRCRRSPTRWERIAGFGDDAPPSDEGAGARFDRLFPTMAAIAAHGHEALRGPGARSARS
jgi:AraC family transcriptional regulator of adaptative response / DNA-3-methyladenine glycosylase II